MVRLSPEACAVEVKVLGTVQGVGFRPCVYRLALRYNLKGWVINTSAGVIIHLEGKETDIKDFCEELQAFPPPLSHINSFEVQEVTSEGFGTFSIHESRAAPETEVSIPPDTGTCPECLREYMDSLNRRHRYDFINCVNCGPRFSITRCSPYDRSNTSMDGFDLCEDCGREYNDPADRRFHAEPNACPRCGPVVRLTSNTGTVLLSDPASCLKAGQIMAVKGLGGYHLACNAEDSKAVMILRERKRRETKPFALMCRDLTEVRRHCAVSPEEEKLLTSPARPIVLLQRRLDCTLTEYIAPGLVTLGVMLPHNPVQLSLFDNELTTLVMTSANISGDPLILTEEEAYQELRGLADIFLVHNRTIVNRADDSVVIVHRQKEYFLRRSRGYVPLYIDIPISREPVFAAGGDLKSVFAFARNNKVMLSQYFGDMENPKNLEAYQLGVDFFKEFLYIKPEKIVADLHPGYISSRFASETGLPVVKVQHHKAHMASCMADNGLNEKVLGVVCDGTGFGEDGTIWGCEFFYGDYQSMKRVGSLQPFKQPRGDAVQKNPQQMAAMFLYAMHKDEGEIVQLIPEAGEMLSFLRVLERSDSLAVSSTSSGRLFDAAAVLCGFTSKPTYEGEPAMVMESLANLEVRDGKFVDGYPLSISQPDIYRISWDFIDYMVEDKLRGTPAPVMAARFHYTIGEGLISLLKLLKKDFPATKVVFSGGTFQNKLLINYLDEKVPRTGLTPYFHRQVPPNDGGLALGQIMLA